jgi:hypothetical protein
VVITDLLSIYFDLHVFVVSFVFQSPGNTNQFCILQKLSPAGDSSTLVQNEGITKDMLPSALTDPLDEINQLRSASGEHCSVTGSASDSAQVGYLLILLIYNEKNC